MFVQEQVDGWWMGAGSSPTVGQKWEKYLIIKRKVSETASQHHPFILYGDFYIYQVDYHKRFAQK